MSQPKYEFRNDIVLTSGRRPDQLDKFGLDQMEIGQSFVIPYTTRVIKGKTKQSPADGFNVKAANKRFAPKVFKKKRTPDGLVVQRLPDADPKDA